MQNIKIITTLTILIAILSAIATVMGIFTNKGSGNYEFKSINNQTVTVYGKGLYANMTADVAIHGIAQDLETLFIAIPLLIFALYRSRMNAMALENANVIPAIFIIPLFMIFSIICSIILFKNIRGNALSYW